MTEMDKFFDIMKDSAKYAVVAASLTSMLVTGFPGAAQAQADFVAKARPSEIAQVEHSFIAGKELNDFRGTVNVLAKADNELGSVLMKMEKAHWRLLDHNPGEASAAKVMGDLRASDIDLAAARETAGMMKSQTAVDFSGVVANLDQQLSVMTKMEDAIVKMADVYNTQGKAAAEELFSGYEELHKEAKSLHDHPSMKFLTPVQAEQPYSRRVEKPGEYGKLGVINRNMEISLGRLEDAILSMNRRPEWTFTSEQLLTKHEEYTQAKDIPLEQVREIAKRMEESGVDVSEIAQNIEQRAEIIGRMETRLDMIIKDYYEADGAGLKENLSLYDMESMEYGRLADHPALAAIRPEFKEVKSSSGYGSGGGGHGRDGYSWSRSSMAMGMGRGRGR